MTGCYRGGVKLMVKLVSSDIKQEMIFAAQLVNLYKRDRDIRLNSYYFGNFEAYYLVYVQLLGMFCEYGLDKDGEYVAISSLDFFDGAANIKVLGM